MEQMTRWSRGVGGQDTQERTVSVGDYILISLPVRIRTSLPDVGERLQALLAPFRAREPLPADVPTYALGRGAAGCFDVALDGVSIQPHELVSLTALIEWFLQEVNRRALMSQDRFVALHAGVASAAGRVVIMPAARDAGKTTTVAGLVRAGLSYLSDEAALIDPDTLLVHPYPRALWMDRLSADAVFPDRPGLFDGWPSVFRHVVPDELRPGALGGVSQIGLVATPRFEPRAATSLRPMSRAETLMVLAENRFGTQAVDARRSVTVLERIARGVPGYRLSFGRLEDAVECIRGLIGDNGRIA